MPMKTTITRHPDLQHMALQAAELIIEAAHKAVQAHGYVTLVLTGGPAPRPLYELLATPAYATRLPWQQTHVFYQDERYVGMDDMMSNANMSRTLLLDKVAIPPAHIHAMPSARADVTPACAAQAHEDELRQFFRTRGIDSDFAAFDIMLGGVGPDGHTASLFPHDSAALNQDKRWVIAVEAPDWALTKQRISMTLPLINHAKTVLMLITAPVTATLMAQIIQADEPARANWPAARMQAAQELLWMIDERIDD